jgi:hypothetical protein
MQCVPFFPLWSRVRIRYKLLHVLMPAPLGLSQPHFGSVPNLYGIPRVSRSYCLDSTGLGEGVETKSVHFRVPRLLGAASPCSASRSFRFGAGYGFGTNYLHILMLTPLGLSQSYIEYVPNLYPVPKGL